MTDVDQAKLLLEPYIKGKTLTEDDYNELKNLLHEFSEEWLNCTEKCVGGECYLRKNLNWVDKKGLNTLCHIMVAVSRVGIPRLWRNYTKIEIINEEYHNNMH